MALCGSASPTPAATSMSTHWHHSVVKSAPPYLDHSAIWTVIDSGASMGRGAVIRAAADALCKRPHPHRALQSAGLAGEHPAAGRQPRRMPTASLPSPARSTSLTPPKTRSRSMNPLWNPVNPGQGHRRRGHSPERLQLARRCRRCSRSHQRTSARSRQSAARP